MTPTIATKEAMQVDAPVAIALNPDKSQLVIGQMGEVKDPGDSLLTFYDKEGQPVKRYKTGLNDITGLAYSPSGKLYATDFACAEEIKGNGGLFELTIEGEEVKTKKIITALKDEKGREVHSEKMLEIQLDAKGKPVRIGDQFGVGRVKQYRMKKCICQSRKRERR